MALKEHKNFPNKPVEKNTAGFSLKKIAIGAGIVTLMANGGYAGHKLSPEPEGIDFRFNNNSSNALFVGVKSIYGTLRVC